MIEVTGLSHHFGPRPVLRDVTLHIPQGDIVALLGPNGMGKSTLLSIIAGAVHPTKGTVRIDGKLRRSSEADELAIRQRVAYLPVESFLPKTMTAREWLLAVGRVWAVSDDRLFDHADRLFELFDLTEKADSQISSLSTGQSRKLALSATLITEAPILLLDEPFAGGLDPSAILALKRILQHHAARRDRTVLFATPVPELVEEVASHIAILRQGQLLAFNTLDALRTQTNLPTRPLSEVYEALIHTERTTSAVSRYLETL